MNNNRIIDYVKIDIEYGEWSVLPQMISSGVLDQIRQLTIEFNLPSLSDLNDYVRWMEMLRSIESYGMIRFHSQPNSACIRWIESLGRTLHCSYDLAWYNNRLRRNVTTVRPVDW